jgi:protein-tyrosine phosphatase
VTTPRWIELDGVVNMRDLGGTPTADGGQIAPGRLVRSDNLQDLTDADIRHLVDVVGVTDVVDLRTNVELRLEGPGPLRRHDLVPHHHHSLLVEEDIENVAEAALAVPWSRRARTKDRTEDAVLEEEAVLEDEAVPQEDAVPKEDYWASHYLGYLAQRPDSVAAALEVVARARGAAIVHCAAGKDRTGTVVGLALSVAGVADDVVVADYVATGERIDRILERLAARPAYADGLRGRPMEHHATRPETMQRILTVLQERHGGAAGWLRDQGWSEDQVQELRSRLRT